MDNLQKVNAILTDPDAGTTALCVVTEKEASANIWICKLDESTTMVVSYGVTRRMIIKEDPSWWGIWV